MRVELEVSDLDAMVLLVALDRMATQEESDVARRLLEEVKKQTVIPFGQAGESLWSLPSNAV
jgi:hypothetical protein